MLIRTVQRAQMHLDELLHTITAVVPDAESSLQSTPLQICNLEPRILMSATQIAVGADVPIAEPGSLTVSSEESLHVSSEGAAPGNAVDQQDFTEDSSLAPADAMPHQLVELVLIAPSVDRDQQFLADLEAQTDRSFRILILDPHQDAANFENVVMESITTASAGLTVGYVVWAVRGGMLAHKPTWTMMDPMMIVESVDSDDDGGDSVQDIVDRQDAVHLPGEQDSVNSLTSTSELRS